MKKCADLRLIFGIMPIRFNKILNTGPMALQLFCIPRFT